MGEIIEELDPDAVPDRPLRPQEEVVANCPLCQQAIYAVDIDTDAVERCPLHTYLHRECWDLVGGCPIVGCENGPYIALA